MRILLFRCPHSPGDDGAMSTSSLLLLPDGESGGEVSHMLGCSREVGEAGKMSDIYVLKMLLRAVVGLEGVVDRVKTKLGST